MYHFKNRENWIMFLPYNHRKVCVDQHILLKIVMFVVQVSILIVFYYHSSNNFTPRWSHVFQCSYPLDRKLPKGRDFCVFFTDVLLPQRTLPAT